MSYRDLRNFTEMMRALGYPRLVSMENFRNPNFPLVAEILLWLQQRFDPDSDISSDIDTETDRVLLIRSVVQFMAVKVNVVMNTKKLYQADGYAVREMLKAIVLLYDALLENTSQQKDRNDTIFSAINTVNEITSKSHDLKKIRQLATDITRKGAKLYDLLGSEVDLRELRNSRLNRQLEIRQVEKGLEEAIDSVRNEVANTKQLIENVSASEDALDAKIEKRKSELERNRNRLQTLQKVRPAFIQEFERLEEELKQLYQEYVLLFRCVAYLEQQHESAQLAEQERMEERQASTRKLLEQFKSEEGSFKLMDNRVLDSQIGLGSSTETEDISKYGASKRSPQNERSAMRTGGGGRTATTGGRPMTGRRGLGGAGGAPGHGRNPRVYGNMTGSNDKGGDADSVSLDSDSDLLLDGSELLASDDDDELELDPDNTGNLRAPTGRPLASRKAASGERGAGNGLGAGAGPGADASDEDF